MPRLNCTSTQWGGAMTVHDRFLRIGEVTKIAGIARSTVYMWVRQGRFPPPYQQGPNWSRWSEQEVKCWMEAMKSKNDRAPTHLTASA